MVLVISNAVLSLSQGMISQQDSCMTFRVGVIVTGLASIIIGEVLYAIT